MREDDVVEILTAMLDADVQSWVDGGWGVDALVGHETRPHKDLDLMVLASQASEAAAALSARGFRHVSGAPPAGLYSDDAGRRVDISVLDPDDHSTGFVQRTSNGVTRYALDELEGLGSIGRLSVRCLTASAQARVHKGYALRSEDHHDLQLLRPSLEIEPGPDRTES